MSKLPIACLFDICQSLNGELEIGREVGFEKKLVNQQGGRESSCCWVQQTNCRLRNQKPAHGFNQHNLFTTCTDVQDELNTVEKQKYNSKMTKIMSIKRKRLSDDRHRYLHFSPRVCLNNRKTLQKYHYYLVCTVII